MTFWQEPDAVVVANRSADPAFATLVLTYSNDVPVPSSERRLVLEVGTLPPCRRVTIPSSVVADWLEGLKKGTRVNVHSLAVLDANGELWTRLNGGLLSLPVPYIEGIQIRPQEQLVGNADVKMQSIDCADGI